NHSERVEIEEVLYLGICNSLLYQDYEAVRWILFYYQDVVETRTDLGFYFYQLCFYVRHYRILTLEHSYLISKVMYLAEEDGIRYMFSKIYHDMKDVNREKLFDLCYAWIINSHDPLHAAIMSMHVFHALWIKLFDDDFLIGEKN